jgi:DSBA-like thioredoxin domain-containing protein
LLSEALYSELAEELGLSQTALLQALEEGEYKVRVRADFSSGVRSGVNGTPAFFINGTRHDGSFYYETLRGPTRKSDSGNAVIVRFRFPMRGDRARGELEERGYIPQSRDGERCRLTLRLFKLAQEYPPTKRMITEALPTMQQVAHEINQSCHLGVLDGDHAVIVAQVDSPLSTGFYVKAGGIVDLFGRALDEDQTAWI